MRVRHLIALGVLAAVAVSFTGCNLLGTSIESRLSTFATALNSSDRSGLTAANFSSSKTTNYYTADATFWDTYCPVPGASDTRYSITDINAADPNNVTATMAGPTGFSVSPLPVSFIMVMEGFFDYRIQEFDKNGTPVLKALTR
jgi:hypothetical protein